MSNDPTQRIVDALSAETSALRDEGVGAAVDFLLSRPLSDLVDLSEARDIVLRTMTEDNLRRLFARHVKPGWRRYSTSAGASKDLIGSFVPDDARRGIRDAVASSRLPRGKWMQGAVEPALLRRLFAPVFTNLLMTFAKRLPIPGGPVAAGATQVVGREVSTIAGRLGKKVQERAERIVDAGRTVMGGLGLEMEKRLQASARDFSESAMTIWRDALRDRLKSDEGRELLQQMSQQATDHVMMAPLAEVHADFQRIPIDAILDLVPSVVAHAAHTMFVRKIVDAEIRAFLEVEGNRSLREVLDELGALPETRDALLRRVDHLARAFVTTEPFRNWLASLLQA